MPKNMPEIVFLFVFKSVRISSSIYRCFMDTFIMYIIDIGTMNRYLLIFLKNPQKILNKYDNDSIVIQKFFYSFILIFAEHKMADLRHFQSW